MNRTALRAALGSACAVLALVGGLVLTGCSGGADPEQLIREDITSSLDELKNMDEETIQEYADQIGTTGLESYGIEATDIIAAMVDGFDYTIDSVEVGEDSATATVTVTSKSMSELMNLDEDAMMEGLMSAIESGEVDINDDDSINAWSGNYMMDMVGQIEPSEKTLEILYNKTDDGWEIDASAATEMNKIFV